MNVLLGSERTRHVITFGLLSAVTCLFALPLAAASTDEVLERLLGAMQGRQQVMEGLLSTGLVGEALNGTLKPVPGAEPLTVEEKELVQQENADRAEVYHTMAQITGRSADQMASERVQKRFKTMAPYVLREVMVNGQIQWADGFSLEEKRAQYALQILEAPQGDIRAGLPFQVRVQVVDGSGGLVSGDQELADANQPVRLAIKATGGTAVEGALEVPLINGVAFWPQLIVGDSVDQLLLTVGVADSNSVFAHLEVNLPSFRVTPAPLNLMAVEAELAKMEKGYELVKNLPVSPSKNRQLDTYAQKLDRWIEAAEVDMSAAALLQRLRQFRSSLGVESSSR